MAHVLSPDVLAIHQEIAALMRAGVPLSEGLRSLAHDSGGKLAIQASDIAARLEQGQPIAQAMASGKPEERAFAAVLAAGLRSGNPAAALEGTVATAMRLQQLRQTLWAELAYPIFLLLLGYGLLRFAMEKIVPVDIKMTAAFEATNSSTRLLQAVSTQLVAWGPLPWLAVGAIILLMVLGISMATATGPRLGRSWAVFARMKAAQAQAKFLDLLALLIEHAVPMPDAIVLAGEGSQWDALAKGANQLSEQLRGGQTPQCPLPLPPMLARVLQNQDAATVAALLRREAAHSRRRAERISRWIVLWIPLSLTLAIGIGYTILLALVNLGPFLNLLFRLSQANNG